MSGDTREKCGVHTGKTIIFIPELSYFIYKLLIFFIFKNKKMYLKEG